MDSPHWCSTCEYNCNVDTAFFGFLLIIGIIIAFGVILSKMVHRINTNDHARMIDE